MTEPVKEIALKMGFLVEQRSRGFSLAHNQSATDIPRGNNLRTALNAVRDYVGLLVNNGEPAKALAFLNGPTLPVLLHGNPNVARMKEMLAARMPHADSWEAHRNVYACFADSAPGHSPLADEGITMCGRNIIVLEALLREKPERVMNVGCGDGSLDDVFLSSVPEIKAWTIADASEVAHVVAALLDRHPSRSIAAHQCVASMYDWPVGQFDCVIASEVIEHVVDQNRFLEELAKRLAPGGLLILTTPDGSFWCGPQELDQRHPLHHLAATTPQVLIDLVELLGLTVEHAEVSPEQHTVIVARKNS